MRITMLLSLVAMTIAGCGNTDGVEGTEFDASWSHTFASVFVPSGTEKDFDCQSWTLNNDETIYVTGVRQTNEGAWHHSNWFHVPEGMFGDDGTWDCRDEGFDSVQAAAFGGVVFAQSTQAFEEITRFPERTAVVIPPRSKIIGQIHLVNLAAGDIDTSLTMEFEATEPEEIDVSLRPLSFLISSIEIPPRQQSRWRMTCDLTAAYETLEDFQGTSDDFAIYYVLGHYHSWGNYFQLSYVDEDGGERTIVELESTIGDNLGRMVDPPVFANGAPGLKVTCGYNNTTDDTLIWGNDADKEMCMFLAYVGAPVKVVSWERDVSEEVGMVDGFRTFEATCGEVGAFPSPL